MRQEEILRQLRRIESELSPENLYQDGELSHNQAMAKQQRLLHERARLVAELGREPSAEELYRR